MRLQLFDLKQTSGAGGSTQYQGIDYVSYERVEEVRRKVLDQSAAFATVGQLLGLSLTTPGKGGVSYLSNQTLGYAYIRNLYGIVVAPGQAATSAQPTSQNQSDIVIEGPALALISPSATTSIAPGSLLCSDGAGGLQLVLTTASASNIVLAIALDTVSINASSTVRSLISVYVEKVG
jgi:hypothetical protein